MAEVVIDNPRQRIIHLAYRNARRVLNDLYIKEHMNPKWKDSEGHEVKHLINDWEDHLKEVKRAAKEVGLDIS